MSRTVTAMYDTRAEADSARERLQSEFDVDSVEIYDQSSSGRSGESEGKGFFGSMFGDDSHAYDEGVRRGSFLLCAEVDSDEDADRIIPVLEQSSAIDFDERQQNWRSEGWAPQPQGFSQSSTDSASSEGGERTVEEERIPLVEEQLQVGKREVERGGARVRSYVREQPVSEQVNLREENVSVERRPVSEKLSSSELESGDLLREREVEMRATGEEPIIGKEARVNEEVVVRKTANEHSEQVQDSVRRTEVDVDEGVSDGSDRDGRRF